MTKTLVLRPLDIVRTPKGAIALVTETNGYTCCIAFFPHQVTTYEKNAWWENGQLKVLGSIPVMLANAVAHPLGTNQRQGNIYFNGDK